MENTVTERDVKIFLYDKYIIINKERSTNERFSFWASNAQGYENELFMAGYYDADGINHLIKNGNLGSCEVVHSFKDVCKSKRNNVVISFLEFLNTIGTGDKR